MRFDLRNCNAMCADCTRRHNENPAAYLRFMNERYGPETVAELDAARAVVRKVEDEELVEALARLKQML